MAVLESEEEMEKERIKAEADAFFEWPTNDKTHVTTTSMLIFANVIAEMARAEEREACATVCDQGLHQVRENGWIDAANELARCAAAIRARSNA